MWRLGDIRWDALTVAQASAVQQACGVAYEQISPWRNATAARSIVEVLGGDPDTARLTDFEPCDDDIADTWIDGIPDSGRFEDAWIAQLCLPPYSFTPAQVRDQFTVRDVRLLIEAARGHR